LPVDRNLAHNQFKRPRKVLIEAPEIASNENKIQPLAENTDGTPQMSNLEDATPVVSPL